MIQYITQETFDLMVAEFLETQNKDDRDEWYSTSHERARAVLDALHYHLFREELERATRYEQYLKLRAEFADRYEEGEKI